MCVFMEISNCLVGVNPRVKVVVGGERAAWDCEFAQCALQWDKALS